MRFDEPHYPVPSEQQSRALVEEALRDSDRVVVLHPVKSTGKTGKVPKRLRSQASVYPEAPKTKPGPAPWWDRLLAACFIVLDSLMYPFNWVGDKIGEGIIRLWNGICWLFRTPRRRRRLKRLKGGWNSLAGGLLSKTRRADHQMLVLGDRLLVLVYVGPEAAELAWSTPRDQLTGVEHAMWDKYYGEPKATLRIHFTDGSWGDVVAQGPGWKQFLEHLPTYDNAHRKQR